MTTPHRALACAASLAAVASLARATPPDPTRVRQGEKVYGRYCVSCHGVDGDGRGPSAEFLDPMPRVLTSGTFKFRSTPSGMLPTDDDLLRTVRTGLHHTNMPRWEPLTDIERRDVVQYIKTFSPRFTKEPQTTPIAIPPHPAFTPQLVQKGQEVWKRVKCAACHGETGKGDGPSAPTLVDDWGHHIDPRDFTHGRLKVGDAPEDLYKTFMTGLNGTPMPSYDGAISADDAWALVAYVRSLRKD